MVAWRVIVLVAVWGINLIIFCHMIWGSEGLIAYRELKQKYAAIEAEIAAIDAENRSLSRDIRLLQTDERYVEKMIRQRLHYVHENEVLYLFGDSSENRERWTMMRDRAAASSTQKSRSDTPSRELWVIPAMPRVSATACRSRG